MLTHVEGELLLAAGFAGMKDGKWAWVSICKKMATSLCICAGSTVKPVKWVRPGPTCSTDWSQKSCVSLKNSKTQNPRCPVFCEVRTETHTLICLPATVCAAQCVPEPLDPVRYLVLPLWGVTFTYVCLYRHRTCLKNETGQKSCNKGVCEEGCGVSQSWVPEISLLFSTCLHYGHSVLI